VEMMSLPETANGIRSSVIQDKWVNVSLSSGSQ